MHDHTRPTEARNARTVDIDLWPSEQVIRAVLVEDAIGVAAAAAVADRLAAAVDATGARLDAGGVIHAFGAGASGRLAVLDATEATPTFGAPRGRFNAHFPGGGEAFMDSSIDLEDAERLGYEDAAVVGAGDVVVGVTASGATAYVHGALARAREADAMTVLICCDPGAAQRSSVDHFIAADTGAEAITGSTRLKAGTATKVLLNAFSTAVMVRAGRTYSNFMVDLVVTNTKLHERAIDIVTAAGDVDRDAAQQMLEAADGVVPLAIVHALTGHSIERCRQALEPGGGVRQALAQLGGERVGDERFGHERFGDER